MKRIVIMALCALTLFATLAPTAVLAQHGHGHRRALERRERERRERERRDRERRERERVRRERERARWRYEHGYHHHY